METSNPADFVGYCGLYCNACGIRQGKIKNAVDNLRNVIAAYGFDKPCQSFRNESQVLSITTNSNRL
ncbi:hypothetical protein KAU92_04060 [Candidatus Bathyarchaeota archaeon]|nr:hypothetical protein [Candidatus Bathyarchaeota archaeon]